MHLPFARAIPTLETPWRGIHLMWTGPAQFLFAPGGWEIERRIAAPPTESETCVEVMQTSLARLRSRLELRLSIGWLRLTAGTWITPEPGPCEIFTLELHKPSVGVSGRYRGRHGLAIGIQNGKAVAFQFLPLANDGRRFNFAGTLVDRIVVYGLGAAAVRFCTAAPAEWTGGTKIAKLHLPLREFDAALANDAGELAEAQRRLAPGESIDPTRFRELADLLRVALRGPGPRPIDNLLRMRGESEDPEQMYALDPLRTFLASPMWRRVVGLAWLDRDPALVPGTAYDYRITGMFPIAERDARVFGFHTIPPGTAIPADFSLADCRFRLSAPATVEAAPSIGPSGAQWATRAGIALAPAGTLPWFGLGIDDFSVVIDLPAPVTEMVFELEPAHDLKFATAAVQGLPFGPVQPVPPGSRPRLQFTSPVSRVGLRGKGFLFAVRLPGQDIDRMIPISTTLGGVRFQETARPEAPVDARIENLQSSASMSSSQGSIRKLHPLGFSVRWRQSPAAGIPFWPTELSCPTPLDATMFQIERRTEPAGAFEPVLGGDNTMFGSRDEPAPDRTILPGVDLMRVFPEEPEPQQGSDEFSYPDVFRAPVEADPARRTPPPPGTVLRYRVRTVDVIGRPSAAWRESNAARLEKHDPPPPPAAYDATPADVRTSPGPTGVYARVLVRGSLELTDDDAALLGDSDNAIVLRWGWRAPERAADPFARHFRVYLSPTFDTIPGEILSVSDTGLTPGDWRVDVRVARAIAGDAAAGLFLQAGYPFLIGEHTAGDIVQMIVRTRIPAPDGTFRRPALGPVAVPLKLAPSMTRPTSWAERFVFPSGRAQLPISDAEQYEAVIRDRLVLTADHPRDALWAGVTSADAEAYVDDTFGVPGPDGPLPGNESPVVSILCQGRRIVRPEFAPPPPAAAVPRVLTPEPAGAPVRLVLDLAPFVAGAGLATGELTQPERVPVASLYAALDVTGDQLVALVVERRDPAETDRPLTLPNVADQAAAVAAVRAGSNLALEDRLAVQLAAMHPYADRLFRSATSEPVAFGPFEQTLPPAEERYIYRIRRADVAGRVSAAAAVAAVIVRVPSLVPGPVPRRAPRQPADAPERLRIHVPLDSSVGHVVLFEHALAQAAPAEQARNGEAQLLRVPNRRELGAGAALRLRLPDDTVLAPSARPLGAASGPDGWELTVDATGAPGRDTMIWAATLTTDGMPSPLGGPWRVTLPKAPLAAPVLTMSGSGSTLDFSWILSEPLITSVWLEAKRDGIWERASSIRRAAETSLALPRSAEPREYRLVGAAQDGRQASSNSVTG